MTIIGSLITFPDKGVGVRLSTAIVDTDVSQIHPRCSVALGSDDASHADCSFETLSMLAR
jgi:hypothetical protein